MGRASFPFLWSRASPLPTCSKFGLPAWIGDSYQKADMISKWYMEYYTDHTKSFLSYKYHSKQSMLMFYWNIPTRITYYLYINKVVNNDRNDKTLIVPYILHLGCWVQVLLTYRNVVQSDKTVDFYVSLSSFPSWLYNFLEVPIYTNDLNPLLWVSSFVNSEW